MLTALIGLLLLVYEIPRLPAVLADFLNIGRKKQLAAIGVTPTVGIDVYAPMAESSLRLTLGVVLLAGANRLASRIAPPAGRSCIECGYVLRGLPPRGMCPECGAQYGTD